MAVTYLSQTNNFPWLEWFKSIEEIYRYIVFTKVNKKNKMMVVKAG